VKPIYLTKLLPEFRRRFKMLAMIQSILMVSSVGEPITIDRKGGIKMKKALLVLGIFCLFLFLGCGQGEKATQPTKSESKEAAEAVKEKAGAAVETVKEETKGATEAVQEKAGEATEAVQEKAGEATEAVQEKAEEATAAGEEKAGAAVEMVKEKDK